MKLDECEHCKSWVRYNASRFECARALSGFSCAFESRDGWKPKTYADLERENAELKEQEIKIEQLEKEIEILKKRVDYFYEDIRPIIVKYKCKHKHIVSENGVGHICYEKQECLNCKWEVEE